MGSGFRRKGINFAGVDRSGRGCNPRPAGRLMLEEAGGGFEDFVVGVLQGAFLFQLAGAEVGGGAVDFGALLRTHLVPANIAVVVHRALGLGDEDQLFPAVVVREQNRPVGVVVADGSRHRERSSATSKTTSHPFASPCPRRISFPPRSRKGPRRRRRFSRLGVWRYARRQSETPARRRFAIRKSRRPLFRRRRRFPASWRAPGGRRRRRSATSRRGCSSPASHRRGQSWTRVLARQKQQAKAPRRSRKPLITFTDIRQRARDASTGVSFAADRMRLKVARGRSQPSPPPRGQSSIPGIRHSVFKTARSSCFTSASLSRFSQCIRVRCRMRSPQPLQTPG